MEESIIKNAVFDYLAGRETALQKQAIEAWLRESSNNETYYQWLHEWEQDHLQVSVRWEQAFDRTQRLMNQEFSEGNASVPFIQEPPFWRSNVRWMVAAVFVSVMLGAAFNGSLRNLLLYRTVKTAYGQIQEVNMEDGSVVILNSNSSLQYPRFGFIGKVRQVELKGEADFVIKHLPENQRFVVRIPQGIDITVLGTEFTVFARKRGAQVALRKGKVSVQLSREKKTAPILMTPGDLVVVDPVGKLMRSRVANPEIYASWKNHQVTLERTSLREIASMMEETYGFKVEFKDPEIADRTATGLLPAQDPDRTLELVAELFDINFSRHNDKILFKE